MKLSTKTITLTGLLVAIELVLQFIGNNVAIGGVSINLSLLPITIGSLIGGPLMGMFLGFVNGLLVLFAPSTLAVFMPLSVGGTILVCLSKSMIAGFVSGVLFKLFKDYKVVGCLICSAIVPLINSTLFFLYSLVFFQDWINSGASTNNVSAITFIIVFAIGWNFIFEFISSVVLTLPAYKAISRNEKNN